MIDKDWYGGMNAHQHKDRTVTDPAHTDGMRWIAGGTFTMGSLDWYPEEAPLRQVAVDGFWIDEVPDRPAARHPETIDTSTSHIGFRCVRRGA